MKKLSLYFVLLLWICSNSTASLYADYLITSYESSEVPPLLVTSSEITLSMINGGSGGAPTATDGTRVLKATWTGQPDGKVEMRHDGLSFDLLGYNYLLIDVYLVTDVFAGSSNPQIGIYDTGWTGTWYPVVTIPPNTDQWFTLVIDVSGNIQTSLTSIQAFLFDYMTVSSGTFYLDNMRLATQIPPLKRYPENPDSTEQGLIFEYFEGTWTALPDFDLITSLDKDVVDNFDISVAAASDDFGLKFNGYIDVPADGNYTFYTESNDGSELYIGNTLVVSNDGIHAMTEQSGSIELQTGKHEITVNFFEGTGSEGLNVSYEGPGISKTAIPNNVLYRKFVAGDLNRDLSVNFDDLVILANSWMNNYSMADLKVVADNWLVGRTGLYIEDGWYYIDGQKFFVKGTGYEPGARPGQYPWSRTFEPDIITMDMNRIIDGGFNTIRTWSQLTEPELALVDSMGLNILLGIYVDSHGDFGDPTFVTAAESSLRNTLSYSKNYDCIIGYLLMNEPITEDIYDAGAAETVTLWTRLKNVINQEHPGIPVSFANTGVGDFINMNIFDLSAYNLYMYGPSTVKHSMGYAGTLNYLKSMSPENPLVVTEYGLSVSPNGPGGYGYGGNSEQEQADGDLFMYRGIIDAGAQGGCVFNYLDGWWKNNEIPNDADTHEPDAEEWFGLWGIEDTNSDPNGTARLAWFAMKEYNMGIITSPKNGEIYDGNVPLEIFPDQRVKKVRIKKDSSTIYERYTNGQTFIKDNLVLDIAQSIKDVNLSFEFYDVNDALVKAESIIVLYCETEPVLPTIDVTTTLGNLNDGTICPIQITVVNNSSFTIKNNQVQYVYYPHIGWNPGTERTAALSFSGDTANVADSYTVSAQTKVVSLSAGITIQYGIFEKRLYDIEFVQRGNWANPISHRSVRY